VVISGASPYPSKKFKSADHKSKGAREESARQQFGCYTHVALKSYTGTGTKQVQNLTPNLREKEVEAKPSL
jgi:hypothetical protein